jgi:hypothetical protein
VTGKPVPATMMAYTDFQKILTDSAFGILAVPLESVTRGHLGDIAVGAKLLLFDGFGAWRDAAHPPGGMHARLATSVYYRLPIAQIESADNFADIGTGDRQPDVDVRAFADILFSRRFWTSFIARYSVQLADHPDMRITDTPGDPFPAAYRRQTVQRDLGDVVEGEVTPRWTPSDYFAFGATYRFRHKAKDVYKGTFTVTDLTGATRELDAATLGIATAQDEQDLAFAVSYSSVLAWQRGRARWPLEVTLSRSQVLTGINALPRWTVTSITMRYYSRLFGAGLGRQSRPRGPLPEQ